MDSFHIDLESQSLEDIFQTNVWENGLAHECAAPVIIFNLWADREARQVHEPTNLLLFAEENSRFR